MLDRITEKGHQYINRKRMNKSDDLWISRSDRNEAVCVDDVDGVYCRRKMFEPSDVPCTCSSPRSCTRTR